MSSLPRLVVPGDVSSLANIAEYIRAASTAAGLDHRAQYKLRLAVDEVATNIVLHGYQESGATGPLSLSADLDESFLAICIEDYAPPYDPREGMTCKVPWEPLEQRMEGGLGLFLAARSVDEFAYERIGNKNRNIFKMYRQRPAAGAVSPGAAQLLIAVSFAQRTVLDQVLRGSDFAITWVEDGREVARCLECGHFELLLLGLDLPNLSGEECLRMLRQAYPANLLPVIIVYDVQTEARLQALLANHVELMDMLSLQLPPDILCARLARLAQRGRMEAELAQAKERLAELETLAHDFMEVILPLGVALSEEQSFERLMERIVMEAMEICNADAGTLYLKGSDDKLYFSIMRTKSLGMVFGGTTGLPVPYPPLPLYDQSSGQSSGQTPGEPNHRNAATSAVLTGHAINVANIYDSHAGFDFSGAKAFDRQIGYRTRSVLTAPLLQDGDVAGALQLINAQDRRTGDVVPFSHYQEQVIESLASQAAISLHNHLLSRQREDFLRMEREMQIGREIQANFLPLMLPVVSGYQLAARVQPARLVSGDFYDIFELQDGCIGLVIADVCDKGIGAALFMGLIRSLLRAFAQVGTNHVQPAAHAPSGAELPLELTPRRSAAIVASDITDSESAVLGRMRSILSRSVMLTNDYIARTHSDLDMFATLFFGILLPSSGRLIYINAGHPPLLLGHGKTLRGRLANTGPAVGVISNAKFDVEEIELAPGELLFGYTDGVTDARSKFEERFGDARLHALITESEGHPDEVISRVERALKEHTANAEQFDDISMLAVRRF